MSRVLPGRSETRARSFFSASRLMREDLPTFDRPMNANSGRTGIGHDARSGALVVKTAVLIFMANQGLGEPSRIVDSFLGPAVAAVYDRRREGVSSAVI